MGVVEILIVFIVHMWAGALAFRLTTWLLPKEPPPKEMLYLFVIMGYLALTIVIGAALVYALLLGAGRIIMFFVGIIKFIAGVK